MNLQDKIPAFITEKRNIVRLILYTAGFALLFINFYSPFGVRYWFNITRWQLFLYSSLVILTGVLVVVISRVAMYKISKKKTLNYWQYFLWVLCEVFSMALFYSLFEKMYFHDARYLSELLKITIQNTALVLLLPYSVIWLYFSYHEKKIQLEELTNNDLPLSSNKLLIPFRDEKGVLRLSVNIDSLLYIESCDNYVNICYLNKGKISSFLLRNTLKKIEEQFFKSEIVRCHRSYMINFQKVKVIRKDKDGLILELDIPDSMDIPVSKSYVENVMQAFAKYNVVSY